MLYVVREWKQQIHTNFLRFLQRGRYEIKLKENLETSDARDVAVPRLNPSKSKKVRTERKDTGPPSVFIHILRSLEPKVILHVSLPRYTRAFPLV